MKIKNKFAFVFLICAFLITSTPPAHAFITFDITKGIGKIFNNVSNFAKVVQEKISDLQNKILGQKWLQDGKNAAKWVREQKQFSQNVLNKYKAIYEDALDSDLVVLARTQAEIADLDRQISALEKGKEEIITVASQNIDAQITYINSQITVLKDNIKVLEAEDKVANEDQINIALIEVSALEEQITTANNSRASEIEQATRTVDVQITSLTQQRDELSERQKVLSTTLVKDFVSDVALMAMSKDLNFVAANDELTSTEIETIRKNRQEERDKVIKEVYAKSIATKVTLDNKISERISSSKLNPGYEELSASILVLTESKIDDIEDLILYVELIAKELKLQTAAELADLNQYQLQDEEKANKDVFDLGDYEFDYKEYKEAQLKKQEVSILGTVNKASQVQDEINETFSGIKGLFD